VCVNGETAPEPSDRGTSLDAKASYFRQCLTAARALWNDAEYDVTGDVLYKTAFTLFKG
ncbi:hypothetical protein LCGC14_1090030, partial [marine sediment metagenome]